MRHHFRPKAALLVVALAAAAVAVSPCVALAQKNKDLVPDASSPVPDAERVGRVALVIGNSAYASAPLKNTLNDARTIAAALQRLGFTVLLREDADRSTIEMGVSELVRRAGPKGVVLVYFSGHGAQYDGHNYLIPVSAHISQESDMEVQAYPADRILRLLGTSEGRLNLLILDSCRNNPFGSGNKALNGGLARMDAPTGTLISYATAPGRVADANPDGSLSLFTQELLKNLEKPGIPVEEVFKRTRIGVKMVSKGAQVPWEESTVDGDFAFLPAAAPTVPASNGVSTVAAKARTAALTLVPSLISEARKTADSITNAGYKVSALSSIAVAQAKVGDIDEARKTFAQARQVADSITKAGDKAYALRSIAAAQARAGDLAGARKTADSITDVDIKARTLSSIAVAQAKAGDIDEARKTLAQARQVAGSITDASWKASALSSIATAQVEAGDIAGAGKTADSITDAAYKGIALGSITAAQAKAGDLAGARKTADSITDAGDKASALRSIAVAQAKAGDIEGAGKTVDSITDAGDKASALSSIAAAQAEAGDLAGARKTVTQARQVADNITDAGRKAYALSSIAAAQAEAGDLAGAGKTFVQARQAAVGGNTRTLSSIAAGQAKAGDIEGARKTAESIAEDSSKVAALAQIVLAIYTPDSTWLQ